MKSQAAENEVELISGATKSSSAYLRGINAAIAVATECMEVTTNGNGPHILVDTTDFSSVDKNDIVNQIIKQKERIEDESKKFSRTEI